MADIPALHESVSKQHAVIVHRFTGRTKDGKEEIKPYLMDLNSTNGTFLNGDRLEPERYYELKDQDSIRVGRSSRDYLVLNTGKPVVERDREADQFPK